jgi:hypothetical protein
MSTLQPLQFYFMPYPDVAPDRPRGQWVDSPNGRFDPKIGHKLYKEYIYELTPAASSLSDVIGSCQSAGVLEGVSASLLTVR